jgi:gamma-glutamyltranspeptidase/glutathione hydrolase
MGIAPPDRTVVDGVRAPAFAPDGRLAVSVAGDLWVLQPDGSGGFTGSRPITQDGAWDRDPAWTPDGSAIVFSSDRAGSGDLWRVAVAAGRAVTGSDGAGVQAPERLTRTSDDDLEPSVGPDGTIVFVRGRGGDSDLWTRSPDGGERRLTEEGGAEREPAWSPDGRRIAFVAVRGGRRELRLREQQDGRETTLVTDRPVRGPTWSPDGARLAFGTMEGNAAGIWTIGSDGRLLQAAGAAGGVPAWSPDGAWIVFAPPDASEGGYNGDPDRLGERAAGDVFGATGGLQRIPAPRAPAAPLPVEIGDTMGSEARNAAAFDRAWSRVARLYLGMADASLGPQSPAPTAEPPLAASWREIGLRHRPAALAALDDDALRDVIYAALRERPTRPEAVGRAAVSSAHPLATAAGLEILELGGNVVDAAVAVSFALGVVEPDASGIGGYGEMLIHLRGMVEPTSLEFMTTLPAAATADNPAVANIPRSGPGVANVPGTVAGMELAWKQHGSGRVSWEQLLAPAIRLAETGFVLDDGFTTTLRREREGFEQHESSRKLFFRDGQPLAPGDTLRNPDLAATLKEIARGGAEEFYRGALGRRMVQDLRRGGNLMTVDDLQRYTAAERRPVRTSYRDNDVYSGPPPVTGGASLTGKLNLLELTPRGRSMTEEPATLHALIEAWKFQPSTGGRVADPDIWPVNVTPFESKDTARARWRCFQPDRAAAANALTQRDCGRGVSERGGETFAASPEECLAYDRSCRATGTTAFVVADAGGNIVSVTQTLGTWGGNFYVSPGLGFLYNDKLRSYGTSPTGFNTRVPHARNTTVIAPTIVFRGTGSARRPWFGVGAAGNAWITSAVYQMVVGIVDHGLGPQRALELPRFLPGGRTIQIEDGFAPRTLRELERMGHSFQPISLIGELRMGYGAAVVIDGDRVRAGGDPRRSGTGGAVR